MMNFLKFAGNLFVSANQFWLETTTIPLRMFPGTPMEQWKDDYLDSLKWMQIRSVGMGIMHSCWMQLGKEIGKAEQKYNTHTRYGSSNRSQIRRIIRFYLRSSSMDSLVVRYPNEYLHILNFLLMKTPEQSDHRTSPTTLHANMNKIQIHLIVLMY